jgi:hypothetical protein
MTAQNVKEFLEHNRLNNSSQKSLELLIRIFDTRFEGGLGFRDFLKMILSKDNPQGRFKSATRANYENYGEPLDMQVEMTLCKFFNKACSLLNNLLTEPDT